MTIRVLLFAALAEGVGSQTLTLELADHATAGDALDALSARFADVAAMRDRLAMAVNHAYVNGDSRLSDDDELALIPPVSGG